ncbi:TIGR03032 family protein, partial [Synechocystis salina]
IGVHQGKLRMRFAHFDQAMGLARTPKGIAVVDLRNGQVVGTFLFNTGVEEGFAVTVLPGYRNPAVIGPDSELDNV